MHSKCFFYVYQCLKQHKINQSTKYNLTSYFSAKKKTLDYENNNINLKISNYNKSKICFILLQGIIFFNHLFQKVIKV